VDTGLASNIGMRLKAVQPYLRGEEMFLANYSDGVSDLPLPAMVDFMEKRPEAVACLPASRRTPAITSSASRTTAG